MRKSRSSKWRYLVSFLPLAALVASAIVTSACEEQDYVTPTFNTANLKGTLRVTFRFGAADKPTYDGSLVGTGAAQAYLSISDTTAPAHALSVPPQTSVEVTIKTNPSGQLCTFDGGKTDYKGIAESAPKVTCTDSPIYLFLISALAGEDFNGFAGARQLCRDNVPSTLSCDKVNAFLASGSTGLNNLPGEFGFDEARAVYRQDGSRLGANWADLFDGSIENAFSPTDTWYSGAKSDGTVKDTCGDWLSSTTGTAGAAGATDGTWLEGSTQNCNTAHKIACLCY